MISVLLPFRNAAGTLEEAAASVLDDLALEDEVVAIDDRSTDGSREILARMDDPRIRIVTADAPGIAAALAHGLGVARGDLVARMDADDVSLPGRIEAERALLDEDETLGAVGVRIELFGVESEGMSRYVAWQNALVSADDHARSIYVEAPLCHPATMIRRDALDAVGGYVDREWPEDWDLWLRLHHAGYRFAKVPEVLFRWRRTTRNVTSHDPRCALERFEMARAFYLAKLLGERRFAIWGAGDAGRGLSRAFDAHAIRASFFLDIDPRKIGRTMHEAPIVSVDDGLARARTEGAFVIVCVAAPGARETVRGRLMKAGFVEGADYVCAS